MERYKIDFQSLEWEAQADGVKFKAYKQGQRRLRLVEFTKEFVNLIGAQKATLVMSWRAKWK